MASTNHLGFTIGAAAVANGVLIPRYYDPEVALRLADLQDDHELVRLGDLIAEHHVVVKAGDEIGKLAYGTGRIPFVRTSDLVNLEIRAEPKQGVDRAIYTAFAHKQDVRAGDILFVRDGTYLVGTVAMVTRLNTPMLYQSHVLRFRVAPQSPVDGYLLLAALSTPVVRRQVRAKQFTADIIDTIGDRYGELMLPVPRDLDRRKRLSAAIRAAVELRADLLERLTHLPLWAEGILERGELRALDEEALENVSSNGTLVAWSTARGRPLVPRYHSPRVRERASALVSTHDLVSIGELVDTGALAWSTGIEVGKLAYGGEGPPFVRTSDLAGWELKVDPKQRVSQYTYDTFGPAQDVRAGDVFVVRDGTYLVGSSAIVTPFDGPMLFAGGLYKLRCLRHEVLSPYLLMVALNTPFVRQQVRSVQFTRDVIDTIGRRLFEIRLPLPRDSSFATWLSDQAEEAVLSRAKQGALLKAWALELEGHGAESEPQDPE